MLQVLGCGGMLMMPRVVAGLLVLAGSTMAVVAHPRTVVGEIVDVRCTQKSADNVGDAHVDCALSCARRGAVMGIQAADGLYIITGDYTAEANAKLIEFVARQVEATGEVIERNGRRTIRAREIKPVTRNP